MEPLRIATLLCIQNQLVPKIHYTPTCCLVIIYIQHDKHLVAINSFTDKTCDIHSHHNTKALSQRVALSVEKLLKPNCTTNQSSCDANLNQPWCQPQPAVMPTSTVAIVMASQMFSRHPIYLPPTTICRQRKVCGTHLKWSWLPTTTRGPRQYVWVEQTAYYKRA